MKNYLMFIYYIGIASCGIQGIQKAEKHNNKNIIYSISAFLNSFGGGIIRDLIILIVSPAVISLSSIPDILVALFAAFFYLQISKKTQIFNRWFIIITDALGVSQFIVIGVDKAITYNANLLVCFLSGVTTAIGGGIIASLLSKTNISKILISNVKYYFIVILGTIFYYTMLQINFNILNSQFVLSIYTTTTVIISNLNIIDLIFDSRDKIKNSQYININFKTFKIYKLLIHLSRSVNIYETIKSLKDIPNTYLSLSLQKIMIFIFLHRILQK